jgi:hypothetical protein
MEVRILLELLPKVRYLSKTAFPFSVLSVALVSGVGKKKNGTWNGVQRTRTGKYSK